MKNSFENLIALSEAAKRNDDLIKNHIECRLPERINKMLEDIRMMIEVTEGDDVFFNQLLKEKEMLESALETYK